MNIDEKQGCYLNLTLIIIFNCFISVYLNSVFGRCLISFYKLMAERDPALTLICSVSIILFFSVNIALYMALILLEYILIV